MAAELCSALLEITPKLRSLKVTLVAFLYQIIKVIGKCFGNKKELNPIAVGY